MLKKRFSGLIGLCMFLSLCTIFCIYAIAAQPMHWYCKRTKDHTQPPIDENMRWIEQYGGFHIDKVHADQEQDKVVYLTFDAGYENGNIEKILDEVIIIDKGELVLQGDADKIREEENASINDVFKRRV